MPKIDFSNIKHKEILFNYCPNKIIKQGIMLKNLIVNVREKRENLKTLNVINP